MTQLVEYGHQGLQSGAYTRAASLFREAVRRAPMRQDLKDYLSMALEGSLQQEERAPRRPEPPAHPRPRTNPEALAPEPPRRAPRDHNGRGRQDYPAPPEEEPEDPEDEDFEEQEGDEEPEEHKPARYLTLRPRPEPRPAPQPEPPPRQEARPGSRPEQSRYAPRQEARPDPARGNPRPEAAPERRDPRYDPRRPAPRPEARPRPRSSPEEEGYEPEGTRPAAWAPHKPIDFNRRHQRGPASAILLGALMGFIVCALAAGLVWVYLKYPQYLGQPAQQGSSQAELNNAIARAKTYTDKGEYAKAIDFLSALPENSERNKNLADIYNDLGDQQLSKRRPPNYPSAIAAYQNAIKYEGSNPKYRNNLAQAYYNLALSQSEDRKASAHALEQAQQNCETVLAQDSKNMEALTILSSVAVQKRDDVLLAKTLKRIIEVAPGSNEATTARQTLTEHGLR